MLTLTRSAAEQIIALQRDARNIKIISITVSNHNAYNRTVSYIADFTSGRTTVLIHLDHDDELGWFFPLYEGKTVTLYSEKKGKVFIS